MAMTSVNPVIPKRSEGSHKSMIPQDLRFLATLANDIFTFVGHSERSEESREQWLKNFLDSSLRSE